MTLLIATQNPGKLREYQQLLVPLKAEIRGPQDLDLHLDVQEDGSTYTQNARKKAIAYAGVSHLLSIADDSGLEVDALHGAPGIRSARYAIGSDDDRVETLLRALNGVPWHKRTARFRCVLVIANPEAVIRQVEGVCEGVIAMEPKGECGFGYDPVFYVPDLDATMAQLGDTVKNRISHRAQAVQAALPVLHRLLQGEGP